MSTFISFAAPLKQLLPAIIACPKQHAKWLNTLSFLENCGARKIAACEHPTLVKEEMLKHAAEEFRHAHYLKRQIVKVSTESMETYAPSLMLGGVATLHYLERLDWLACRYLKSQGLNRAAIREAAYLLVTYAIELRADELYRIYDEVLKKAGSKVAVKSILMEEKEHLNEMIAGLEKMPSGSNYATQVCGYEAELAEKWIQNLIES